MTDPLVLLARLEREKALLESVAESRTSAPDAALGAVEIDDQMMVSTLIRLKAEHSAQRAIKPQHVQAALALARDPAFAHDPLFVARRSRSRRRNGRHSGFLVVMLEVEPSHTLQAS